MSYLTLNRLRNVLTHSLQGGSLPATMDQDEVINDAGRWFFSAHPWNFRHKPPATLAVTAGQPYIELPYDFGEMVAFEVANGMNYGFNFTTPQALADQRASSIQVTSNSYLGAILWPRQATRREPPTGPRIEIWPTPQSDVSDLLSVWYLSTWTDLTDSDADEVPDIPPYAEACLQQAVRIFASGWAERLLQPEGGIDGMLARLLEGGLWATALRADGAIQNTYGPLRGGAVQSRRAGFSFRSASSTAVGLS